MKIRSLVFMACLFSPAALILVSNQAKAGVSLEQAVSFAQENDPWLQGNRLREQGILASSIAADSLPDPVLSLGLLNLPTNGFAFDQEAMTQMKVGIAQMFPRGDSRGIRSEQLQKLAAQHPLQRQDRRAKVSVMVAQLWLQAYQAQQQIALIEQDKVLFEQLANIVEASYSSAQAATRQQDVVRAQLEISRIEDRLSQLYTQQDMARAQLGEWLSDSVSHHWFEKSLPSPELGSISAILQANQIELLTQANQQVLADYLSQHPSVQALVLGIDAEFTGLKLAEQKYKPQWGVNGSYAYRADTQAGASRADFFSVGLSVDLPLFTANRQDQDIRAARMQAEAAKTDKRLLLRSMLSQVDSLYRQYKRLVDRNHLYQSKILKQMHQQAEASLTAYTNDDGDFAEVMRARIAELNALIEEVSINTQISMTLVQLGYFFTHSDALVKTGEDHENNN